MLTLKFNDRDNWEEHDWLVMDGAVFVAGFASSNAATRFIDEVEAQRKIARALIDRARADRRRS